MVALAFVGCSEDDAASSLATNFDELEFSYEESDQQLLIRSTVPWTLECTYLTGSQWLSFDKTGGPGDEGIVSQRVTIKALRNTGVERRAELHVTGAGFDRKVTIVQEDGQVHIDGVELEGASHNLPVVPQTKSERWRWTKGVCYAWMSYLYLYVGDWANAKKWAEEVIKLGVYDLYRSTADPADSFRRQFIHEAYNNDTKESILTTELGMRQVQRRLAPPDGGNGQTGLSPTASLIDEFELLDGRTLDELPAAEKRAYQLDPQPEKRDPRLGMSIIFPTETFLGYTAHPWEPSHKDAIGKEGSTKTGYWIKKWANETDRTNYSSTDGGKLDFQNMRYAVVLLNYVEAAIELNQLSDPNIYDYLDDIRDRAGMPAVDRTKYATQTKLRELVRRERRVELAFEGHRLFDIRRWRIAEQVMNGEVYGATPPGADDRYLAQTRVFNPKRDYLWPIPVGEMNTNTAMEQNPGY